MPIQQPHRWMGMCSSLLPQAGVEPQAKRLNYRPAHTLPGKRMSHPGRSRSHPSSLTAGVRKRTTQRHKTAPALP